VGVVVTEVVFDGQAPELARIAEKVTALCGLPVTVTGSDAEIKGDLYDLHAHLAFACAPETQLELCSYIPGAVQKFYRESFGDADFPFMKCMQGLNELPGSQSVHLRAYVGQEPTLFFVTELALEALGGRPREPIPDDVREEYGVPITAEQLQERHRKLDRQMRSAWLLGMVLLPVLIPLWLLGFLWFLVSMPWRIWKAYRFARKYMEEHGGEP